MRSARSKKDDVIAFLRCENQATRVASARLLATHESGVYSIFIDAEKSIPEPFKSQLRRSNTRLIYIGKAGSSMITRLFDQDLRHTEPATFFRGLGAVLGYRPLPGSLREKKNKNNYVFSPIDTNTIIQWIAEHLSVRWIPLEGDQIKEYEPAAINECCPLFNKAHNPRPSRELAELRKECRRIACN